MLHTPRRFMRLALLPSLRVAFAAACLASLALAQRGDADELFRYRGGGREALVLDRGKLAVECEPGTTEEALLAALRHRGVAATRAAPTGVPRWFEVELAHPIASLGALRHELARAHTPPVAFAAPVLVGSDGAFVTITRDLLLRARADVRPQAAAVLAELVPDAVVLDPAFGGMAGALQARSRAADGLGVLAEANRLAADARVEWAEPDWQFAGHSCFVPNDPGWPQLWGMLNSGQFGGTVDMDMDCDLAWDITTGSAAVKVAVLDVGVEAGHPDLNQLAGADVTGQGGGGAPVNACDNHGTMVAGCIAAILDNALGTAGVAPDCPVLSARTFVSTSPCNGGWTSNASWTVNALAWAQAQGARVTNNSNNYGFTSAAIDAQYAATWSAGMVHFASAGNNASTTITYPASIAVVNAVAALAPTGSLSTFSNSGVGLDFAAPGEQVYSTDRTGADGYYPGDYGLVNGTSFASPYAAAVAALVLSQTPSLSPAQVELAMRAARDLGAVGYDTTYGWGFVNANSALRSIPYGSGLGGAFGLVPQLFATGVLRLGSTFTVDIDRATGGSLGVLGIGLAPTAIPVFNGTVLVAPPWVTLTIACGGTNGLPGTGTWSTPVAVPATPALVNTSVFLQAMLIDVAAPPTFLSFTNGLQIRVGP
ncbi:MAG: S8 family serine peptidase [Pirellulales bacterium]